MVQIYHSLLTNNYESILINNLSNFKECIIYCIWPSQIKRFFIIILFIYLLINYDVNFVHFNIYIISIRNFNTKIVIRNLLNYFYFFSKIWEIFWNQFWIIVISWTDEYFTLALKRSFNIIYQIFAKKNCFSIEINLKAETFLFK